MLQETFRRYVAAIADEDTAEAAEIYANHSDDTEFVTMVEAFHLMIHAEDDATPP